MSASANPTIPASPLTLEGSWLLHQMARFRWVDWAAASAVERDAALDDLRKLITALEAANSGIFRQFGHKGDLMFVHFRGAIDELHEAENVIAKSKLGRYLDIVHSYLSVVELGLYESSVKTYEDLVARGIKPHTDEWDAGIKEVLDRQRTAMQPRLQPQIPAHKYVCFYPMSRRRGEHYNWYSLPIEERARLMHEHGMTGRRYMGKVRQIISGSVGLDDWEWGVDLFSDEPLVFKDLVYVMRFDEVSVRYAEFGGFHVGTRSNADDLCRMLAI